MVWQGEVLKAVIFPASGEFDAADLWKAVTGTDAPNVQRSQLPPQLRSVATGAWGDELFFQLAVQVGRIEAVITAIDPTPNEPTPLPDLSPEGLERALVAVAKVGEVLADRVPAQRLAAHAQVVQDVESEQAGTALLNAMLGDVFPVSTTTQLYQINSPRALNTPASHINRLVKWGCLTLKQVTVAVAGGGVAQNTADKQRTLVFMHLDINTVQSTSPLPREQTAAITAELWGEARRVISGGRNALV